MIIKTLAELAQPDEASLHFTPWGLGPKMRAEDAAEYQQKLDRPLRAVRTYTGDHPE